MANGIINRIGGYVRQRRTARVLDNLSPRQLYDIGLNPWSRTIHRVDTYHGPTQRFLDSLR